ncbi:MAG: dephospho-CoA kinase [Spirochaetaceae bacterium]|nr:MAG: dephospho-CoA kinase [Spirochaetaceae bacterium]
MGRVSLRRIIGVAGKICSGKSAFTTMLRDCSFHEIDVDAVGHEVVQEQIDAIEAAFGAAVVTGDRRVDRKALGRIVFADAAALRKLEQIVHPRMVEAVHSRIRGSDPEARIVVNAALLFHMGLHTLCDHVVVVRAWFPVRLIRSLRRDGHGLKATIARFARQRSLSLWGETVDITIVRNSTSRRALQRRVAAFLRDQEIEC